MVGGVKIRTPIHDELHRAILDGVSIIVPASDRLADLAEKNPIYEPVLLEIAEAFEALERALALLQEDKQRLN